jgi:hypothetical protein
MASIAATTWAGWLSWSAKVAAVCRRAWKDIGHIRARVRIDTNCGHRVTAAEVTAQEVGFVED